jgi:hypothetical protein
MKDKTTNDTVLPSQSLLAQHGTAIATFAFGLAVTGTVIGVAVSQGSSGTGAGTTTTAQSTRTTTNPPTDPPTTPPTDPPTTPPTDPPTSPSTTPPTTLPTDPPTTPPTDPPTTPPTDPPTTPPTDPPTSPPTTPPTDPPTSPPTDPPTNPPTDPPTTPPTDPPTDPPTNPPTTPPRFFFDRYEPTAAISAVLTTAFGYYVGSRFLQNMTRIRTLLDLYVFLNVLAQAGPFVIDLTQLRLNSDLNDGVFISCFMVVLFMMIFSGYRVFTSEYLSSFRSSDKSGLERVYAERERAGKMLKDGEEEFYKKQNKLLVEAQKQIDKEKKEQRRRLESLREQYETREAQSSPLDKKKIKVGLEQKKITKDLSNFTSVDSITEVFNASLSVVNGSPDPAKYTQWLLDTQNKNPKLNKNKIIHDFHAFYEKLSEEAQTKLNKYYFYLGKKFLIDPSKKGVFFIPKTK